MFSFVLFFSSLIVTRHTMGWRLFLYWKYLTIQSVFERNIKYIRKMIKALKTSTVLENTDLLSYLQSKTR